MGQPSPAPDDERRAGASGRRLWFDLHSWVGLKLSLLMAFVCLTGTLAVFSHEIDWLLHPEMRVEPAERTATWGSMLAAVRAAHPDWKVSRIDAPWGRRFAAAASVQTPEERLRFVWIDPHRGTVTGDTGWFNAQRFLRNTHRHLMLPTRTRVARGSNGFGYDPIFVPDGESRTSAELDPAEKDAVSHRAQAQHALQPALRQLSPRPARPRPPTVP